MECEHYNQMLSALCDGALSGRAVRRVEGHIASCRRCQEDLREIRALKALLRSAPSPMPEGSYWSNALREARQAALQHRPVHRQKVQWAWGAAVAWAAVLLLLALPRETDHTLPPLPVVHPAALVSLHTSVRAGRPLADAGALGFAYTEATAVDLNDNQLDID